VTLPGVEPTNNLAEQAIRFVVSDRHITQGTRSEGGRHLRERIGTVIATCVQQGQSVYSFLREAVRSWLEGESAPSLLPTAGSNGGTKGSAPRRVRDNSAATKACAGRVGRVDARLATAGKSPKPTYREPRTERGTQQRQILTGE